MDIAHYHYLRECELNAAWAASKADIAAGRFVIESVDEHMARLEAMPAYTVRATPCTHCSIPKST
jgi:hypothetical protein